MPCRQATRHCGPARGPCRSPRDLSDPCPRNWRRARIPPSPPSRRYPSAAPTRKRRRPCRARLHRWRGWRAPWRREIPRFRRPARCGGRCGFSGRRRAAMSSPAARASLIIGLVSGLYIQRAPRSNGTPNVAVSVRQRPPAWPDASTTITLRFAAMTRRAAAMPAAPAPITTMSASRGNGAARRGRQGPAPPQGPRTRRGNRGASLSCHGFRNFRKERTSGELAVSAGASNHHGESIMIDRRDA